MQHEVEKSFNGRWAYPWDLMAVGDYFEMSRLDVESASLRVLASGRRKRGQTFTVQTSAERIRVTRHK